MGVASLGGLNGDVALEKGRESLDHAPHILSYVLGISGLGRQLAYAVSGPESTPAPLYCVI